MTPASPLRLAFIGDGAMTRAVCAALKREGASVTLLGALDLPNAAPSQSGLARFGDRDALIAAAPDLVLECASQEAVRAHGTAVLAAGIDFSVISSGALGDPALAEALREAARGGGTQCFLPAGALAGIEALSPARLGGIDRVAYRAIKPARAWAGTPAAASLDLDALEAPQAIYSGDAAEAARLYPKNANVAVTAALYGVGLERTQVTLIADPTAAGNRHEVTAEGAFGRFSLVIGGPALADNPKTSQLAALSVADLVLKRGRALVV